MKLNYIFRSFIAAAIALSSAACSENEDITIVNTSAVSQADDFTDPRDGHVYKCIKVGNQIWMAENLSYYLPNGAYDGCYTWNEEDFGLDVVSIDSNKWYKIAQKLAKDPKWETIYNSFAPMVIQTYIDYVTYGETPLKIEEELEAAYPLYVKELRELQEAEKLLLLGDYAISHTANANRLNGNYSKTYGYLYSLDGARKAVPDGWRLPTDKDWMALESALGMKQSDLNKLEEWRGEGIGEALNIGGSTGMNLIFGGCDAYQGQTISHLFIRRDECGFYWTDSEYEELMTDSSNADDEEDSSSSDTETDPDDNTTARTIRMAYIRQVAIYSKYLWRGTSRVDNVYRPVCYSVRCVKDA